ncbi:MAG: polysaccharide deacetylase family protein [Lentisphaeria bacterium]|nr:polysaccharide deacetylase family protein [Lentisphaeria bacterium]
MNILKRRVILIAMAMLIVGRAAQAGEMSMKMAIIKADDIRGKTAKWERFFALSQKKGVKVSAGIICESLQSEKPDYVAWLKKWQSSGLVEFWNHGWDHKRWTAEDGKELREFSGSGYEHQKRHFDQSQALMKKVLGAAPVAFGAPYNAIDADTAKVLAEDPDTRLFFGYGGKPVKGKLLAPMMLRGEADGTGKPNFEKFKAVYVQKKNLSFTAIQFHPNSFGDEHFAEYAKILDFLIAEGWIFVLPAEYAKGAE